MYLMPSLPVHSSRELNQDTMSFPITSEAPHRQQQLTPRSRSAGPEPQQPGPDFFKAHTADDSDAPNAKKDNERTYKCGMGPITFEGEIGHGRINIMPQSIVEGRLEVNQNNHSSCSILVSFFASFLGAALAIHLLGLLELRGSS
ncbi:hypothetical protein Daesc_003549 [Daldinia eschscholtzii]|uniref:Uncharacterized protein n=1 Tax=Daldinia eschscholtzii TaxID=292717 RepID=A0AAX6MTZ9_9PEZI